MSQRASERALRVFAQSLTGERGEGLSLDVLCRRHPELEAEFRELERLRSEAQARATLAGLREPVALRREATLTMDAAAAAASKPGEPTALHARGPSRYVLLGDIARGGMGVILHVWDTVLRRPLAMKVLELDPRAEGSDGATRTVARFLEEAHVVGQLEHPGVVPIHDLGRDDSGRVYFTMPLIEGRDLNQIFDLARAETEGWTLTRALLVMAKVCDVMAYAHSRDMIHRDLKPANVMVGKFGETYVIDWGLAKSVGSPDPEALPGDPDAPPSEPQRAADAALTGQTLEGTVLGTPAYMAPEQAEGQLSEVSSATDVYALGAMLYRLLAGRSPYASRRGEESGSRTLELVRRGPPTPLARIAPDAPVELMAICEKAMARKPVERYASVEDLASELAAFLEGRVVGAYERGFWAQAKKLVQRNRLRAGLIGALVFTAFAAMGVVTWVHTRANRALETKNVELRVARAEALESAQEERELRAGAQRARYAAEVTSAATSLRAGDVSAARRTLVQCSLELRGFEWAHLWLGTDGSLRSLRVEVDPGGPDAGVPLCVSYEPRADTFVAGYSDGGVRLWDTETGSLLHTLEAAGEAVLALETSRDGELLVSASADGRVRLYELGGQAPARLFEARGQVCSLAFDPRGTRIAACTQAGSLLVFDLAGSVRELARVDPGSRLCFAVGGTRLFCAGEGGTLLVFDPDSGAELVRLAGHRGQVFALAGHPGSARIATAGEDGSLRVWDAEGGELVDALGSSGHLITALAFHPAGTRIASGDRAGEVRIWDLSRPSQPLVFQGHEAGVTALAFDATGARLMSGSWDRTLRVWNARGPVHVSAYRAQNTPLRCAAFSDDGARVLLGSSDGFVILYDALRDQLVRSWTAGAAVTDVSFLDGDRRAVAATLEHGILTWEIAALSDEPLVLAGHSDSVYAVSACDARLVSGAGDGTLRIWDAQVSRCLPFLSGSEGPVLALSVAPRAGRVAASSADGRVRVGAIVAGELIGVLGHGTTAKRAVALHPDGETLAWADDAGHLELARTSGERLWSQEREDPVLSLAWAPAGDRLAAGTASGSVELWDVRDGACLLSLPEHPDAVHEVAFDRSGERLLSVSTGGGLRILESTALPARSRAQAQSSALASGSGALVERLFAAALGSEEILRRAASADELTAQERELAVRLARSNVYGAQRLARASQAVVATPGATLVDYQSALERLREASKLVPGDPALQAWVGAALVRTADPEAAIEVLERVLPELGTLDRLRSQAFLGLARCAVAQTASARELFDQVTASLPPSASAELRALRLELERCLTGVDPGQEQ